MSANTELLEQLQRRHAENSEEATKDLNIPGYDGMFVARYERLPWETVKRIAKRMASSKADMADSQLDLLCDTLAQSCVGVFVRKDPESELVPVEEMGVETPGYSAELAALLGAEASTAREAILAIFPAESAVINHGTRLTRWQQYSDEPVEDF